MYKTVMLLLAVGAFLCLPAFAQEEITLTTYYPSPSGIYQRLVTQTLGVGDIDGSGNIDAADTPDPNVNPGDVWIAGNVGIRTNNPQANLHIAGSTIIEGGDGDVDGNGVVSPRDALLVQNYLNGGGALNIASYARADLNGDGSVTSADHLGIIAILNGTPLNTVRQNAKGLQDRHIFFTDAGNVGIGTMNPGQELDVVGNNARLRIGHDADNAGTLGIQFGHVLDTTQQQKAAIYSVYRGDLGWGRSDLYFALDSDGDTGNVASSDAKMVISNEGDVGIGTTSPASELEVNGAVTADGFVLQPCTSNCPSSPRDGEIWLDGS